MVKRRKEQTHTVQPTTRLLAGNQVLIQVPIPVQSTMVSVGK